MADLDFVYLLTAMVCSVVGFAWLALAMPVHWQQVCGSVAPEKARSSVLRGLGWAALLLALGFCLLADPPSMAILVWVMLLALAIVLVALVLNRRAQWLRGLVFWAKH